jgi:hypothetical protein
LPCTETLTACAGCLQLNTVASDFTVLMVMP